MSSLIEKTCVPCVGGVSPLSCVQANKLLEQTPDWQIVNDHHLNRHFKFKDFKTALYFVNKVGEISEQENHHPDIYLSYGKVQIDILTHKINGLTENDFILAAKVSNIFDREFSI